MGLLDGKFAIVAGAGRGLQIRLHATIEVNGACKPSLVADLPYRFYA